jgi:hypothetical protein
MEIIERNILRYPNSHEIICFLEKISTSMKNEKIS